jgi:hypothetical protein
VDPLTDNTGVRRTEIGRPEGEPEAMIDKSMFAASTPIWR